MNIKTLLMTSLSILTFQVAHANEKNSCPPLHHVQQIKNWSDTTGVFVPNFSRVLSPVPVNQYGGIDILGQHYIHYNLSIVETKLPYYGNFTNLINYTAGEAKTSLGQPIVLHPNTAIINTSQESVKKYFSKYSGKLVVKSETNDDNWTNDSTLIAHGTSHVDNNKEKSVLHVDVKGAILNGEVYNNNDVNLILSLNKINSSTSVKDNKIIGDQMKMYGETFNVNIASGSTFVYEVPQHKHHHKNKYHTYVLLTPTVINGWKPDVYKTSIPDPSANCKL